MIPSISVGGGNTLGNSKSSSTKHSIQKTKNRLGKGDEAGDAYCFVAIERYTKLILAWHLGRRTTEDTELFIFEHCGYMLLSALSR